MKKNKKFTVFDWFLLIISILLFLILGIGKIVSGLLILDYTSIGVGFIWTILLFIYIQNKIKFLKETRKNEKY